MQRIFFFIAFFRLSLFCGAQSPVGDSLKKLLDKHQEADSMRVIRLSLYAYDLLFAKPEAMMRYADEAFQTAEKLGNAAALSQAYQIKAMAAQYISNDLITAIDYYQKSIDSDTGNVNAAIANFGNIAGIFYNFKQYDRALEYYKKALPLTQQSDKKFESTILANMGNVYYDKQAKDTAKHLLHRALALVNERKNITLRTVILNTLGVIAKDEKKFAEAQAYTQRSLHDAGLSNQILLKAYGQVTMSHIKSGMKEKDSALYYGLTGLATATAANSMQYRREAWDALATAYENIGNYKKAYEAAVNFAKLNDSLLSDEQQRTVTRSEMQYQFDKVQDSVKATNEKQQALSAANLKQQRTTKNFILTGSGIVILSALLLFISYKRRRDAVAKKNDAELKAQIADTEMKVMRLQMNPHFIFNSLNSIADYIHKNNPAEADAYLSKFAKVMRMTLEHSEQKAISLEDDLKTLEIYMQLEAKRLNNKFTYEIKVAADIDQENTLVPPMIFQPFVENSIWHGITKKEGQGHIIIDIKKEAGMLYCLIDDNGVGRYETINSEELITEKKSLGMKITKARIDILNKLKDSNATVQLIDKPQGLSAELKLPFETAF